MSFPTPDEIDKRRLTLLKPTIEEIKAFVENSLGNGNSNPCTDKRWPREAIDEALNQIDDAGWDIKESTSEGVLTFSVSRKDQPNGPPPRNQRKVQSRQTLER